MQITLMPGQLSIQQNALTPPLNRRFARNLYLIPSLPFLTATFSFSVLLRTGESSSSEAALSSSSSTPIRASFLGISGQSLFASYTESSFAILSIQSSASARHRSHAFFWCHAMPIRRMANMMGGAFFTGARIDRHWQAVDRISVSWVDTKTDTKRIKNGVPD